MQTENGLVDRNGETGQRYFSEEKAAAVRMIGTLRAEPRTDRVTGQQLLFKFGDGFESVFSWVRQADIDDGLIRGFASDGVAELQLREQENRELTRANEILKRATSFSGAELDRQHRTWIILSTITRTMSLKGASLVSSSFAGFSRRGQARVMRQETAPHHRGL